MYITRIRKRRFTKEKRFLYKTDIVICTNPEIDIEVRANLLGAEGWEMVSAIEPDFSKKSEHFILILIFKKEHNDTKI